MFEDTTLPNGTRLTAQLQRSFRFYGEQVHYLGLQVLHPQRYNHTTLEGLLTEADQVLSKALLPVDAVTAALALRGYFTLAANHSPGLYLCHYCTDETFKGAEEDYPSSGLAANLVSVLT